MTPINYKLLSENGIFLTDLRESIARNRGLPEDWCKRKFENPPLFNFKNINETAVALHKKLEAKIPSKKNKIQIVVDSDLDGICSAALFYKFIELYYDWRDDIECVYSIHEGKQHGLSNDIKIDDDTTVVVLPDAGSNDVRQCKALFEKDILVICLDHHIIEQDNPYAHVVNCMDGQYENQNLCGAAVTWCFLRHWWWQAYMDEDGKQFLKDNRDLVAIATISDIMPVTNEDNMYFIQNGLSNIHSNALKAFLQSQEIPLDDVTIEHIKYKVAPLISAMIRMGNMDEKDLLFRAFIDDYEEFDYEKRGSLSVETENIYDRVVRLCKNAKSRQDRAKQKLLDSCQVHEYEHILLVEYPDEKASTLTGLVANELANQYCKPCIVYHKSGSYMSSSGGGLEYSGSIRNYDGSPISSFKDVLEFAFGDNCMVQGHDNAAGIYFFDLTPDEFELTFSKALFSSYWDTIEDVSATAIGEREYNVDFEIDADDVDAGFVQRMSYFDHYSGYGFAPVTVLIHGIHVDVENFKTMGKNSLSWKICGDGVEYVKFKIQEDDPLLKEMDDIDFGFTTDKVAYIDAICTFGINVYKGVAYPQCVVKDYDLTTYRINNFNDEGFDDDDCDLDLDLEI